MTRYLVFVIGAPGSGKGTLCKKLESDFGYAHLSIGDHLRKMVTAGNGDASAAVLKRISNNELLDIVDLEPILTSAINALQNEGAKVVLVDGFPRDLAQAHHMEMSMLIPDLVIHFHCSADIVRERYLTRRIPGRDDRATIFDKRYNEFTRLNGEIVEEYRRRNILTTVDSSGETDTSYEKLLSTLKGTVLNLCTDL